MVLALPIAEASAKIRSGGPGDDETDLALPVWAGVVPMKVTMGPPVADSRLAEGVSFSGLERP
ncbi:hypothetical protein D3C87_2029640 [compost metagenome]